MIDDKSKVGLIDTLANLANALVGGLASAKPVDEGCGVCPDAEKQATSTRPAGRRPGSFRRGYSGRRAR